MSAGVGRYRKVYPRIWRHPGFCGLSESAQRLALYILTGPQSNRCGVFMFSIATAAEDLNVSVETCRRRLADVSGTFGWMYDADARVLYIPSWWTWNPPENHHVLAGNLKDLNEVPPCGLTEAFACNIETLPQTCHQTFTEGIAGRLRQRQGTQKQELYLKQEKKQRAARGEGSERGEAKTINKPTDTRLVSIAHETLKLIGPNATTEDQVDTFHHVARRQRVEARRAEIITALTVAQSEARTA